MAGRAGQRLTKAIVEALRPPTRGSVYLGDSEVPGFAVRVHAGAQGTHRAYLYRYTRRGAARGASKLYVTIGEHGQPWTDPRTGTPGTLTCEVARREALRLRGLRNAGGDPAAAYRAAPAPPPAAALVPTLREFADTYMAQHANVHKSYRVALADRGRLSGHILPRFGGVRLDAFGPQHVAELQATLRGVPVAANRCLALLSHMFTMARRWGTLPRGVVNPCTDVERFPERQRDRYLTPDELGRIGRALAEAEAAHPFEVAAIRVLMFTGARPSEVAGLERERLQLAAAVAMVNRKGRWLPLHFSAPAVLVLKGLPATRGNPHVFPDVRRPSRHLTRWQLLGVWNAVRKAAGCEGVHLYDVRHTFASVALADGASLEFIGGLLGHTNPRTTKRYAHLARAAAPIRAAGDKAARGIARALKGR